ncbi:hypothetical protein ACFL28_00075 [Candidatus Omnitrophota bacterium]
MDKTLRSILWILIALVLVSSFSTGWFFVAKERLHNEYVSLESLFKTSTEKLNRELASSDKKNIELRTKLEVAEKEMDSLQSQNKRLEAQHRELLEENDDLDKELATVKRGKFSLEERIKDMSSEKFLAGLLKEKVSLEVALKSLKETLVPKDLEIEGLKKDVADLNTAISRVEEEKDFLEQKVKDSSKVADILSRDLLKEKDKSKGHKREVANINRESRFLKTRISSLEQISDKFNKALLENEDMKFTLSSLKRDLEYKRNEVNEVLKERENERLRVSSLEKELENKRTEFDRLRTSMDRKTQELEGFRAEAYHAPEEVELPPIILEKRDHGASRVTASPLEQITESRAPKGRVLTVNREYSFVVIDVGMQDGINGGANFNVYRGGTLIGSIEVIQTRERISACDIKDVNEGFKIEIDDVIARR